jgi:UDP-2,4-diacetamido-2,4,6-trideoxy-beta-L-altropyranose hydrolase
VSIAIIPEFHGQGYGLAVLKSVDKVFANCHLHAVVKETNLASQKLFKKAGYKKLSNENFIREPLIRSS